MPGLYNEILVGRFNRALQKLLGVKGAAPAPQLSSEIMPVLPLGLGIEFDYHYGWEHFGVVASQAAVAAQTSDVRLRNPSGSNVIAIVEGLWITNSTAAYGGFIENGAVTGDLASNVPLTNARLDSRGRPQPTLICSKTTNGAALNGAWAPWMVGATGPIFSLIATLNQEAPLLPGDALQVSTTTLNIALSVGIRWRERSLEESELR